jgi:hypothetical protein
MGYRTTLADALHQAALQSEDESPMGKKEDARKCLNIAREMVDKMEYHRRDKDLKEIDEQIDYPAT